MIKLQNEEVIFEIVFGMVHGWPYERFQKIPHIPVFIIYYLSLKLLIIGISEACVIGPSVN